ncbi:MAG: TadE family protein [Cyanobacteria bacterium P01_H01_bin.74]
MRKTSKRVRFKFYRGQAVIEIIASLIIFTVMVSLTFTVSAYLYLQHAMTTAAREGARQAALNADIGDTSTEDTGISAVETYVENEIFQLTGQPFDSGTASITVRPPSASANQASGSRDVRVDINWTMANPVNISGFFSALGADGSAFERIPVVATATMRYEE